MRVVHPKLSNRTIYGCYQLLESTGIETKNKPMTTVITTVLNSLIQNVEKQKVINKTTENEAESKLYDIIGTVGIEQEKPKKNPLGDIDLSGWEDEEEYPSESVEEPPPTLEDITQVDNKYQEDEPELPEDILSQVRKVTDPLPITEEGINEDKIDDTPIELNNAIPPWEVIPNMKTFEEIKEECPMDRFVEVAEDKNSIALKHTIEVVYHTLPLIDWGSTKAEQLIHQNLPIISKYCKGDKE